ncbi:TetR/AcrR family transcriptional regulator [uncultured Cohaesibacter sp.]|uniref:TetR/AcrR family transcriptional regulator n=1 Tax=uncultured Cohaesibacter sp. TaxID=1002546 RepID=UPI00292DE241|nr:TetR/AcrR family transcriptional regulator [uncultured Cohaesibacter sp.]
MNSARRQLEIVNAAFDCIAASGHLSLSTTELANKVGISQPAIFRHFRSKQQLHRAILDEANLRVIEELKLNIGRSEMWSNPINLLQDVVIQMGSSFERSPGVWLTLICQRSIAAEAELPVDEHVRKGNRCAITQCAYTLERLCNAAIENGQISHEAKSRDISNVIMSLIFGMGQLWLNNERDFALPQRLDVAVGGVMAGYAYPAQAGDMPISAIA